MSCLDTSRDGHGIDLYTSRHCGEGVSHDVCEAHRVISHDRSSSLDELRGAYCSKGGSMLGSSSFFLSGHRAAGFWPGRVFLAVRRRGAAPVAMLLRFFWISDSFCRARQQTSQTFLPPMTGLRHRTRPG